MMMLPIAGAAALGYGFAELLVSVGPAELYLDLVAALSAVAFAAMLGVAVIAVALDLARRP